MSKYDAHICDGGCGEKLVVDSWESIHKYGWLTTYTPDKNNSILYACSPTCMIVALRKINSNQLALVA